MIRAYWEMQMIVHQTYRIHFVWNHSLGFGEYCRQQAHPFLILSQSETVDCYTAAWYERNELSKDNDVDDPSILSLIHYPNHSFSTSFTQYIQQWRGFLLPTQMGNAYPYNRAKQSGGWVMWFPAGKAMLCSRGESLTHHMIGPMSSRGNPAVQINK